MKQTLIFDYLPTDANTYINKERTNRFIAADIKRSETDRAHLMSNIQFKKQFTKPVTIHFIWYVTPSKINKRFKDPDNIAFAKKFLLDGIVRAGILKNDSLKEIKGFSDEFVIDTAEQVTIDIVEV